MEILLKKTFKCIVYFTCAAYPNLDTKFSSEILPLYFSFIEFRVEKVDCHIEIVPNSKFQLLNLNLN